MKWFRFYQEVLNDPKVQSLEDDLFKFWVNILCVTSQCNGVLPSHDEIAFYLRRPVVEVKTFLKRLSDKGLLDISDIAKPHNWDKRQYKSDTSIDRTRKYREKKKRFCDVTPPVTKTPPDTDTETDIEDDNKTPVDNFRQLLIDRGFYLNHLNHGKTLEMFHAWYKDGITPEEALQAMDRADAQLGKRPDMPSYYRNIPYQIRDEFKKAQSQSEKDKHGNNSFKKSNETSLQRVRRKLDEIAQADGYDEDNLPD